MDEQQEYIEIPNETEKTEAVYAPRISEKILKLILTGILFVLLVCMILLSDKLRDLTLKLDPEQTSVLTKVVNLIPDLTPETAPVVEETTADLQEEYYVLQNSEGVNVATISARVSALDSVALWNDYLFYALQTATQGAEIYAKNIKTLEVTPVFTESDELEVSENRDRQIGSFEIINDTLVFSVGGYFMDGAQFKLDLPPTGKAAKITSIMSGNVIPDWYGYTWIRGGFGDACAGETKLYRVNTNTWKVELVADVGSNCDNGEEIIGVDIRNRLLLSGYKYEGTDQADISKVTHKYITSVYVENPDIVEGIIAAQDMPSDIKRVHYDDINDSLVLSTENESYIYSLKTKTSTKSAELVPDNKTGLNYLIKFVELKDKIQNMDLPEGFVWVRQ